MNDPKSLALKAAAAEFHYQLLKDSKVKPHVSKANQLRFLEAIKEFEISTEDLDEKSKDKLLRWGKEVVEARVELFEIFRDSPAVRLFQVLMGYNKYWCFKGYKLTVSKFPHDSDLKDRSMDELIRFVLNSPEREIAMEALTLLAGAVQNWSLGALVDIKMAINDVKRKEQGSFSKAEVIEILENVISQAKEDLL